MKEGKSWTIPVQYDEQGQAYIVLPDDAVAMSGFAVGDQLYWHDNKDGSFTLSKDPPKNLTNE